MLCLAHAPCLNVLGDGAVHLSLEAGLEFADAHAGDACKALQRYVKSIVVVYIAYGVLYPADILCGKGTLFFISLPAVNICHQRYCLRDLCLVKKRSGKPIILGFCCWTVITLVSLAVQYMTGIYSGNIL